MGPFLIFAFILTILYIIYYAVIITQDIYKKKDQQNTDDVESFDVSKMNDNEEPIEVTEKEDGFSLNKSTNDFINTSSSAESENMSEKKEYMQRYEIPADSPFPNEIVDDDNNMKMTIFDGTNVIQPESSVQLDKIEMKNALLTKGSIHNLLNIDEKRNEA